MARKLSSWICAAILVLGLLVIPSVSVAAEQGEDAVYYVGSGILSILYFPVKLVTCGTTQVLTSVAYVATFDVDGSHDGGDNGKDIGEVARRACGGAWVITPSRVKEDYK